MGIAKIMQTSSQLSQAKVTQNLDSMSKRITQLEVKVQGYLEQMKKDIVISD